MVDFVKNGGTDRRLPLYTDLMDLIDDSIELDLESLLEEELDESEVLRQLDLSQARMARRNGRCSDEEIAVDLATARREPSGAD